LKTNYKYESNNLFACFKKYKFNELLMQTFVIDPEVNDRTHEKRDKNKNHGFVRDCARPVLNPPHKEIWVDILFGYFHHQR